MVLVKQPVCLQLNSALLVLDTKLIETGSDGAERGGVVLLYSVILFFFQFWLSYSSSLLSVCEPTCFNLAAFDLSYFGFILYFFSVSLTVFIYYSPPSVFIFLQLYE